MKMLCITIRIKRNDELQGKRLHNILLDFLIQNKIAGATVWTGVDGFGKRKRATIKIEGITINMPLIIEVIDEPTKLESLLPQIKRMVDDNGIITLHQVDII
jgi:PII-like signaling protein